MRAINLQSVENREHIGNDKFHAIRICVVRFAAATVPPHVDRHDRPIVGEGANIAEAAPDRLRQGGAVHHHDRRFGAGSLSCHLTKRDGGAVNRIRDRAHESG